MPKGRYLDTKFWSDGYIAELDPVEKLLYLYFLTNEKTVISGIYELPLKYMAVETGIEKEMIEKILRRFKEEKKILNIDGYIIVKNFAKHQNTNSNDVVIGIKREFESLPENIQKEALNFGWSIDSQGIVGGGSGDVPPYLTKLNLTKPNLTDTVLFNYWNELAIIKHKVLTGKMSSKIKSALKEYSEDEIKLAMDNYARVIKGKEYFWSYRWGLDEFIARGLTKFLETPIENFLKERTKEEKVDNWRNLVK